MTRGRGRKDPDPPSLVRWSAAADVAGRHVAVTRRTRERAVHGQHRGAHRLLHRDGGTGERQTGDLLGPQRVGAVRRADDVEDRRDGGDGERRGAVLDGRLRNPDGAGDLHRSRVLAGRLVVAAGVGAGGLHVGRGREVDANVAVAQASQRTAGREGHAVVGERRLGVGPTLEVDRGRVGRVGQSTEHEHGSQSHHRDTDVLEHEIPLAGS